MKRPIWRPWVFLKWMLPVYRGGDRRDAAGRTLLYKKKLHGEINEIQRLGGPTEIGLAPLPFMWYSTILSEQPYHVSPR